MRFCDIYTGTNGEYCVCYKPSKSTEIKAANWGNHYAVDSWDDDQDATFDEEKERELNQEESIDDERVYIKLYQNDFEHGTFRIIKSGTYTLMENIKFNFNAGGIKHPNAEYSWMPYQDQEDDYPGASQSNHDGFYSMGFFAGITVETDNVVIDLNGFEMSMDKKYYIQQRFFVCISLTNKLFNDNDGITFMGIGQKSANNVVIKNGVIGLSSHMGIFGIDTNNIHLLNLHIRDFETHGIALDKFDRFTMKNVEIGPSVNGQLTVNKRYTSARLMLPIFYSVAKEYPDIEVPFYNRGPFTMNELIDRLLDRMDLAFEYAMNGLINIDQESDLWKETNQLFINKDGVSQHNTLYGLVLRPKKGGYSEYDDDDENNINSKVATIEDLYIHDLIINPQQITKIGVSSDMWLRNSFNAPIDLSFAVRKGRHTEEWEHDPDYYQINRPLPDITDAIYYGDVYTDALVAVRQLSDSWWSLGTMVFWPKFIQWTQGGKPLSTYLEEQDDDDDNDDTLDIKQICGYDRVSGISNGVIGIRITYSQHIEMNNVEIENLINMGDFGNSKCDYNGNNYVGNQASGISIYKSKNIDIEQLNIVNIVSFSGASFGINIEKYDNNKQDFTLKYAKFTHIDAGVKAMYDGIDMSKDIGVNKAASSCAIYCENNCDNIKYYDIEQECINGHIGCLEEYNQLLIHHECQIDVDYETPMGIIHVKANGDIDADLILPPQNPQYTSIIFKGWYFAVAIVIILAILAAIKCVYFLNKREEKERDRDNYLQTNQDHQQQQQEPLIRNRTQQQIIDYNTL